MLWSHYLFKFTQPHVLLEDRKGTDIKMIRITATKLFFPRSNPLSDTLSNLHKLFYLIFIKSYDISIVIFPIFLMMNLIFGRRKILLSNHRISKKATVKPTNRTT